MKDSYGDFLSRQIRDYLKAFVRIKFVVVVPLFPVGKFGNIMQIGYPLRRLSGREGPTFETSGRNLHFSSDIMCR